jgi:outer membrane protein OmpA-like peptidoglycan-associated protein
VCLAVLTAAAPAWAQDPVVIDPYQGATPPPGVDITGSVRALEPRIRVLEPVVRDLRTEVHRGERTTVTISTDVLFDFDSAELTPSAARIVSDLASRVAGTGSDLRVVGHTDAIGTRQYNQRLSERRADAVAGALRDRLADDRTIVTEGRNFSEPVAPETINGEDNPKGRARNRRVEISFEEPPSEIIRHTSFP